MGKEGRRVDNRLIPKGKSRLKSSNRAGTISKYLQPQRHEEVDIFLLLSICTEKSPSYARMMPFVTKTEPALLSGRAQIFPGMVIIAMPTASLRPSIVCYCRNLMGKFYVYVFRNLRH